jgi:hypothetical protein
MGWQASVTTTRSYAWRWRSGTARIRVVVEYAKAAPEDLLIRISIHNRGPEAALLHVLPTLWFRNTWSWPDGGSRPILQAVEGTGHRVIHAHDTDPLFQESLDDYDLFCEGTVPLLFTENETNTARLFGTSNTGLYVKDRINNVIVHGQQDAVNPAHQGTKASPHYQLSVEARGTQVVRLRLMRTAAAPLADPYLSYEPYGLMLRRGDADFRLAVNRVLSQLYRSGQIYPIYERWFGAVDRASTLLQTMYRLHGLPE